MARKSLFGWVKVLLAAALMALAATAAEAQVRYCAEHGLLVTQLAEKFQERQFASGTIGQVAVMEVFVGAAGSWTIIVTDVTGTSCIVAAGENWESNVILSGENV